MITPNHTLLHFGTEQAGPMVPTPQIGTKAGAFFQNMSHKSPATDLDRTCCYLD
jgi:hypothetical protein